MGVEDFSHNEQAPSSSASSKDMEPVPIQPPLPHAEHGPVIDHKIPQEDAIQASPELLWSRIRHGLREPFAEFWVGRHWFEFFEDNLLTRRAGCLHPHHVW